VEVKVATLVGLIPKLKERAVHSNECPPARTIHEESTN
jgi:hypothetical protein